MRAKTIGPVTLAAVLALAGCGGGEPPRDAATAMAIRASVRAYVDALARSDFERACDLMTPATKRALRAETGDGCPVALGRSTDVERAEVIRRQVAGAPIATREDRATLGPVGDAEQAIRLLRLGGRWLIAG